MLMRPGAVKDLRSLVHAAVTPYAYRDGLGPAAVSIHCPRDCLRLLHRKPTHAHLLVHLELWVSVRHLLLLVLFVSLRLRVHLRSGLLLRLGLMSLLLGRGLLEGFLLLEKIALAVRAAHRLKVVEVDHFSELAVAAVAVVGAESAANLQV
mmetsp:Transcript_20972/g.28215  ORF Transcript_20972/g.28215 Transcript_20972/m.28215 type:complete len:151 (-) Transcript_20972:73-525(-)